MKIIVTLVSLLALYSCGKSGSGGSSQPAIENENDPCSSKSLCTNERRVRSVSDLRSMSRDTRGSRSSESYNVGYTYRETEIELKNEYNWETNTFSGDCVNAVDTVKTVYKIKVDQVDDDGDKFDEFILKTYKENRRLITETPKCLEDFNNSEINTDPRFQIEEVYQSDIDYSDVTQAQLDQALKEYDIFVLKFRDVWAMRLISKNRNNYIHHVYRWNNETDSFEEREIKARGYSVNTFFIENALGTPQRLTRAYLGEQLIDYSDTIFIDSWFEADVDPSEIPGDMQ